MRTILIIVLGLFIAQNVSAQVDSMIIKLGDYGQMIIISSNLVKEKQVNFGLNESYQNFYNDFEKINKSGLNDKSYLLNYSKSKWEDQKNRSLSVKPIENEANMFYFQDDKTQSLLTCKYRLELDSERKVIFQFNSLNDFEKVSLLSLDSLYLQALQDFQSQKPQKMYPYMIFYSSDNSKLDKSSNLILRGKSQDYIELNPTFGMSMINSTFAPEISINLNFMLNSKGILHQKFGLSTTFLFIPDKSDFFNISTYKFVNANYFIQFKDNLSHKISIGYMYGRNGSDFSTDTWNAYWQTNINKIGFRLGGFYTRNAEGNRVILPSIGLDFGF
jgi:hypothetical protein